MIAAIRGLLVSLLLLLLSGCFIVAPRSEFDRNEAFGEFAEIPEGIYGGWEHGFSVTRQGVGHYFVEPLSANQGHDGFSIAFYALDDLILVGEFVFDPELFNNEENTIQTDELGTVFVFFERTPTGIAYLPVAQSLSGAGYQVSRMGGEGSFDFGDYLLARGLDIVSIARDVRTGRISARAIRTGQLDWSPFR